VRNLGRATPYKIYYHASRPLQTTDSETDRENQGAVRHWQRTSGENEYKLQLRDGEVITVDKWLDKRQNYRVEMLVYSAEGEVADRVTFTEHDQEFIILDQFYDAVRRSFFKVDSTFQKIIQEIDEPSNVGIKI